MWFALTIIAITVAVLTAILIEELFPLWLKAKYGNHKDKEK